MIMMCYCNTLNRDIITANTDELTFTEKHSSFILVVIGFFFDFFLRFETFRTTEFTVLLENSKVLYLKSANYFNATPFKLASQYRGKNFQVWLLIILCV